MSYHSFSTMVIGARHADKGKQNEDCAFHYDGTHTPFSLAVVADGHGEENCFRAVCGAKFAAECAKQALIDFVDFLEAPKTPVKKPSLLAKALAFLAHTNKQILRKETPDKALFEKYLHALIKHIVARWHIAVEEDIAKNPFTEMELAQADDNHRAEFTAGQNTYKAYGTTLIAAAITDDYWFGIHIGDGRLTALYADGTFDQPVPWDERCFLNVTTSICDDDASNSARFHFSFHKDRAPPIAIFLCTDGVDDSYYVKDNEQYLYKFYRNIALAFVDDGFESACIQLKDSASNFATKGSQDDASIAGFIDMEAAKMTSNKWREQLAAEKSLASEKVSPSTEGINKEKSL